MMKSLYHRHLGIYGVCVKDGRLLVIHKNGGPYTGRFDLPGGSIEPEETILHTVAREFMEETGIQIRVIRNIGTKDFVVPWSRNGFDHTHCHHIAVFYEVEYAAGDTSNSPNLDDSLGAEWIHFDELTEANSSPLIMEAKDWLTTGIFNMQTKEYTI